MASTHDELLKSSVLYLRRRGRLLVAHLGITVVVPNQPQECYVGQFLAHFQNAWVHHLRTETHPRGSAIKIVRWFRVSIQRKLNLHEIHD
eukprot:8045745-Pyramimonas_sp.AAC.1